MLEIKVIVTENHGEIKSNLLKRNREHTARITASTEKALFGHEHLPKLNNGTRNAGSGNKNEIQFQQTECRCQPATTQRSGELVTMDVVGYPQNLREIVRRF